LRGTIAARQLGFDAAKLMTPVNSSEVTVAMKSHVRLADELALTATRCFVIKDVAINGDPGRIAIERIIQSLRQCDNVVC
jgi:hypothetical protein